MVSNNMLYSWKIWRFFLGHFAFPIIKNLANSGLEKNLLQTKQQLLKFWLNSISSENAGLHNLTYINLGKTHIIGHKSRGEANVPLAPPPRPRPLWTPRLINISCLSLECAQNLSTPLPKGYCI
jgi:hypothetical protein